MNEDEKTLIKSEIYNFFDNFIEEYFAYKGEFEFNKFNKFDSIDFYESSLKKFDKFIYDKVEEKNKRLKKLPKKLRELLKKPFRRYFVEEIYK